ncbi:MAG: prepilin-type N-terminal cleavage/methylation domain-containing protein, partial [Planctomycetia bacterium]|nr:prepilin-type N-terminal cleavage/methylation domain-containing protein [Planctomycetia bacterium]
MALSNLRRTTASQAALPGRRSGFTLIELLVTMVILTILVGLSAAGLAGV